MVSWLLLAFVAADGAVVEALDVLGFSADGKHFAAVVSDPGATSGRLMVRDVATNRVTATQTVPVASGKAQLSPELLTSLGLGSDPGQEKYVRGTKLRADVDLSGPVTVEIVPPSGGGPSQARVKIGRGPWCTTWRALEVPGESHNLVSVLASRDGGSLAVVLKHTVAGTRRHAFATAAPGASQARCRAGERLPTDAQSQRCREAATKLPTFVSDETVKDFEGGAELPRYCVTIEPRASATTFAIVEEPAIGPIVEGNIEACWQTDDAFTLRLSSTTTPAHEVFDVQLVVSEEGRRARVQTSSDSDAFQVPSIPFRRGIHCR